jgi:hypothetical protein
MQCVVGAVSLPTAELKEVKEKLMCRRLQEEYGP